ncbi:hypothetical protein AMATHDRAFT_8616 [Amanita thiersii Skay4041]|uniref:Phosphomannose isomerase type I catalytic domain-containing protein n=1 Tax=Amanita thiersii Skay4041 TaxID=703135 RepID=A0A2A9NDM4_9AGAR|nr:hypothetical protein AMATHDRAFT_8616 [Amanita thiersii Skay4041]
MSSASTVFKSTPTIQEYDWGRVGGTNKVTQFAAASVIPGFAIDDARPYTEIRISANPSLIGQKMIDHFGAADGNLPFLFKVLSISKAQRTAAPTTARHLQRYNPNRKPEMAFALTPFLALCGFRPLPEIALHLQATAELAALIPPQILDKFLLLPVTNASQNVTTSPGSDPMDP